MSTDLPSLPFALDRDFNEKRSVRRDRARQRRCNVIGLLDPHAFDAHAGRQMHEVEVRARQIHLLIGVLGAGFEFLTPDIHIVFEDSNSRFERTTNTIASLWCAAVHSA